MCYDYDTNVIGASRFSTLLTGLSKHNSLTFQLVKY